MAVVHFIKVDGTEFYRFIQRPLIVNIEREIGATILDTVNLRDGRVMLVDDNGIRTKPVNPKATEIFQSIYPGARKANGKIHGDVAIAVDSDF